MKFELSAKALEWQEDQQSANDGWAEWYDRRMGFGITFDPSEPEETRYCASWGEGDAEHFSTLEGAQAWCQQQANAWVCSCAHINVIAA